MISVKLLSQIMIIFIYLLLGIGLVAPLTMFIFNVFRERLFHYLICYRGFDPKGKLVCFISFFATWFPLVLGIVAGIIFMKLKLLN